MPILAGSLSMTRFNVASIPAEPDFDELGFREILPGSEVRESIGFVPFEPGEPYLAGTRRFAFRVRIDRLTPDPTAVKERFSTLLRTEREFTGAQSIGPKKRRELKILAEQELLVSSTPRSKIIEGVIDDRVLYLATTANAYIGKVIQLLRRAEIIVDFKTPWIDLGEPEIESEILDLQDPIYSAHGANFLKWLVEDEDIRFEPVGGYVRLQTRHARITVTGAILRDLYRYVEEDAEVLSGKLITGDLTFRLDALPFRISGCSLPASRHDHWIERLDERLEAIDGLWQLLDQKYQESKKAARKRGRSLTDRRLAAEGSLDEAEVSAEEVPF